MSHTKGQVLFKDGTIMHYEYNGTSDVCRPRLYFSVDELLDNWRCENNKPFIRCNHISEDVKIYTSYADGAYWNGKACRKCNTIIDGLNPYELNSIGKNTIGYSDGTPSWIEEYE